MSKNGFIEYIKDVLEPFGPINVRLMFGGCGIYKDSLMIGLIAENELYFKADVKAAEYFRSYGSEPFVYQGKNKPVAMSYWKVLPEIIDDPEALAQWVELACDAAISAKKKKG